MKLKSLWSGIAWSAVCFLSACGDRAGAPPAAASKHAVVVTDALDRAIHFDQPPRRIAIAGKASFMIENAIHLFPEAREKGVDFLGGHFAQRAEAGDFLALVAPDHAAAAIRGGEAGVEQIAATQPDVVLMKSSVRRTGDALDGAGLPVVFLDFETPAQYERDLAILGQMLAATNRAGELIAYYRGVQAAVRAQTADLAAAATPRTLLIQYAARSGTVAFSVPPPDWIQTEMVELAGGSPVWKDAAQPGGWTVVNLEQIAAWDPDVVLVVNYRGYAAQTVETLLGDPSWKALRATRTRRIYAVPGDYCSWDQPDPRWGLGLLWMATRLHPDRFADVDLSSEIYRFYALYGLEADAVREHVLPLIHENLAHVRN